MPKSELGCCAGAIKVTLVILNIIFGVVGIIVLAIGIWALVENQDLSFIFGDTFLSGGGIMVVAGLVTIIICFIGIFGAIFQARPLLVTYAIIVTIIIVLEIVAGIVVFVFRDQLLDDVETNTIRAISLFRTDEDAPDFNAAANNAIQAVQTIFDCCGFNNATDWIVNNSQAVVETGRAPFCPTCTVAEPECTEYSATYAGQNVTFLTTNVGCGNFTSERFVTFAATVGGIGIAVGIMEIVCALFAIILCCCITSASKQETV